MSVPQSPKESLNIFKDEIYGSLRKIEADYKSRVSELESNFKKDIENFNIKLNVISQDSNELKEAFIPYKVKIDKIAELEKFKNKVDDMLITHEVRIKNNFDEIRKFQLRYDKLISENLYVPGFIGNSCQFKTLSDYLMHNINEVSKIKLDKEQTRKDIKELKMKQESMMKTITTLNESTVQMCNAYTDGKNIDIKRILNFSLKELNQKSLEMRAMIHQFAENAKKFEDKNKEELEKIIEIKNEMNEVISESKKFNEEINKKIKENINDINTNKRKTENLVEQIKEINKNINNINVKLRTSNNVMNNRTKINLANSVISPMRDRKFRALLNSEKKSKNSNSPIKTESKINLNKSRNRSELSDLESIITENSIIDTNQKETKNVQVNTDINEIIELKKMNYSSKNNNTILNTISNMNDINNNINKIKINNDSMNNTNTNSFNIPSVQNSKTKLIKNTVNNTISNNNLLPSILKKKEKEGNNLLLEENKKANDDNPLSTKLKKKEKFKINRVNTNMNLKIKSTNIVFHLDEYNNNEESNNNNINQVNKKKSIDKNHLVINHNFINNDSNTSQPKQAKFNHRKEILIKRNSDSYKQKEKEKQGVKLVSILLPEKENDANKNKNIKDEVSNTIDNYRANAFSNIKNVNENNINSSEEMLDFPRKVNQAFGRTTYNFISKNDVINHINANNNINNFELMNNKNKK